MAAVVPRPKTDELIAALRRGETALEQIARRLEEEAEGRFYKSGEVNPVQLVKRIRKLAGELPKLKASCQDLLTAKQVCDAAGAERLNDEEFNSFNESVGEWKLKLHQHNSAAAVTAMLDVSPHAFVSKLHQQTYFRACHAAWRISRSHPAHTGQLKQHMKQFTCQHHGNVGLALSGEHSDGHSGQAAGVRHRVGRTAASAGLLPRCGGGGAAAAPGAAAAAGGERSPIRGRQVRDDSAMATLQQLHAWKCLQGTAVQLAKLCQKRQQWQQEEEELEAMMLEEAVVSGGSQRQRRRGRRQQRQRQLEADILAVEENCQNQILACLSDIDARLVAGELLAAAAATRGQGSGGSSGGVARDPRDTLLGPDVLAAALPSDPSGLVGRAMLVLFVVMAAANFYDGDNESAKELAEKLRNDGAALTDAILSYHGIPPLSYPDLLELAKVLVDLKERQLSGSLPLGPFPECCVSLALMCRLVRAVRQVVEDVVLASDAAFSLAMNRAKGLEGGGMAETAAAEGNGAAAAATAPAVVTGFGAAAAGTAACPQGIANGTRAAAGPPSPPFDSDPRVTAKFQLHLNELRRASFGKLFYDAMTMHLTALDTMSSRARRTAAAAAAATAWFPPEYKRIVQNLLEDLRTRVESVAAACTATEKDVWERRDAKQQHLQEKASRQQQQDKAPSRRQRLQEQQQLQQSQLKERGEGEGVTRGQNGRCREGEEAPAGAGAATTAAAPLDAEVPECAPRDGGPSDGGPPSAMQTTDAPTDKQHAVEVAATAAGGGRGKRHVSVQSSSGHWSFWVLDEEYDIEEVLEVAQLRVNEQLHDIVPWDSAKVPYEPGMYDISPSSATAGGAAVVAVGPLEVAEAPLCAPRRAAAATATATAGPLPVPPAAVAAGVGVGGGGNPDPWSMRCTLARPLLEACLDGHCTSVRALGASALQLTLGITAAANSLMGAHTEMVRAVAGCRGPRRGGTAEGAVEELLGTEGRRLSGAPMLALTVLAQPPPPPARLPVVAPGGDELLLHLLEGALGSQQAAVVECLDGRTALEEVAQAITQVIIGVRVTDPCPGISDTKYENETK
ncbi:hypothetical protein VOLCADRAFT_121653 [Volvox carteri f. nagariensis]|uniref:Ska2 N-terminal domain-containing protein n=1 Tax=Volvox carteri f. nagariensis TaxID=3068 RepID=D8UGC3_VOLCA|nr:uncharacterized protein VOLCADRAFT_121653 [Volvox carteri f. nagariensis]EFJ41264.1 hypothetical protein VOLCADRAFT_121653 [Volvox carteri f. nagariensis]|eukprot:XP_002957715.1 hypothetical protein VOLCADRAFT_121653 [Volvox carteri f. nagariensis]